MKIGVVLTNWNGGEFTIPCINSLLKGSRTPDLIVVVDNDSNDGSPYHIEQLFPEVAIIRNSYNNGFAGACNQGIQYLLSNYCDYIWVLNNDTLVALDCLFILQSIAFQHPTVAGFSGKIYFENPNNEIWYAGAYRHSLHFGIKHWHTNRFENNQKTTSEVDFLSGCCMFVNSNIFLKHGGFIEKYIAYAEDNEWCWRLTNTMEIFLYVPSATIWHRLSASVNKNFKTKNNASQQTWFLMSRNHFWTIRMHCKKKLIGFAICINLLIVIKKSIIFILFLKFSILSFYIRGVHEGLSSELPSPSRFK